jgi:uncharacterized protein YqcC (DUF446 family)
MTVQRMHDALNAIEAEMRCLGLWREMPPAPAAFESEVPFFLDTMALHEWMQWVFVARFRALLDGGFPLPDRCAVAPVLQEYCSVNGIAGEQWVALVQQFDLLVTKA